MSTTHIGVTTYYQFEVDHPIKGWVRVGHRYAVKETAKGWRSFVKAAWNGLPTRLAKDTMPMPIPAAKEPQ